ncbi:MAG: hypothetical protein KAF91_27810 [Nostoc sp. TH1S01]|nr:hypothetical protein [Nostoc sp. TH1S01]
MLLGLWSAIAHLNKQAIAFGNVKCDHSSGKTGDHFWECGVRSLVIPEAIQ